MATYGGVIARAQRRSNAREFTSTVKDSPYFLGFLLTLLGLFTIFITIAIDRQHHVDVDVGELVGQAGGAILATVIGLFFRQILWSHDKVENEREVIFQNLSETLRNQAVEYQTQQAALATLVGDFVKTRKRLQTEEEKVHSRYLQHLEQTSNLLDQFNAQYPDKVAAVLTGLEQSGKNIAGATAQLTTAIETIITDLSTTVSTQAQKFTASVSSAVGPIDRAGAELATTISGLESRIDEGGRNIGSSLQNFAKEIGDTPASLWETASSFENLRISAKGLEEAVQRVITSATFIDQAVAELVKGLASDTASIHVEIQRRAETLRSDMHEVDQAFEELIALIRRRLMEGDFRLRTDSR